MAEFTTSASSRERDHSRPTTPTGSTRTFRANGNMRALDTRPQQPETFFDDATPVDGRLGAADEREALRHSHDLSFTDDTRDSVVDNMLLSLDQLPAQFSQPPPALSNFPDPFFLPDNPYPPPHTSRQRGHTYTSSQSSDYEAHVDETASRYSNHHSRTRRSNSSNNIPNLMSRKSSLRGPWPASKSSNGAMGEYSQTGHRRGVGKQGSKSSNASSMDYGHAGVVNPHRLGLGSRSGSIDHGQPSGRASPVKTESILDRTRQPYQNYHHEYDAAPQPTIPAGPRRPAKEVPQTPVYPPQPSYAPPQAPVPRRKGSVRSTTSYRTLRKNKSQPEPNMRLQAQEFVNASNMRDLAAIPRFPDPPAPSPTVATRKHSAVAPSPITTPKEKPGFFRRVFGGGLPKSSPQLSNSSMNSNASHLESPPPADVESAYSQPRPRTTPNGSNHIASQAKSPRPRVPQTATSMQNLNEQPPPPTLAKKHSSFFRRRKKSVTESPKAPVAVPELRTPQRAEIIPPGLPSPGVSSLRRVMNPYLNDLGTPADKQYDPYALQSTDEPLAGDRSRGFSPGYKPHKDATVRAIKPDSRGAETSPPSSRGEQLKTTQQASTDSPKLKLKIRKAGRTNLTNTQEDSFLADSSSCNDDRSGRVTPVRGSSATRMNETQKSRASPTSSAVPAADDSRGHHTHADEKRANLLDAHSHDARAPRSASVSRSVSEVEDEGWVVTSPTRKASTVGKASGRTERSRSRRVWLEPTSSEEKLAGDDAEDLGLPLEGARASQKPFEKESPTSVPATTPSSENDVFHSATSLPTVQVEGRDTDKMSAIAESRANHEEPTDADRERALRIFSGDEAAAQKAQAAAILGDVTLTSTRTRRAFMELFNWTGFSILAAMRDLCGKLVLKAETQQVDRILMSLSERWCECNPNHGFKAIDVVHTICYSILLLNTDLHVADIESRMTRSQFVKNTLPTVARVCQDALKDAPEQTLRPQSAHFRRGSLPWNDKSEPGSPGADNTTFPTEVTEEPENRRARSRLSIRPPQRSGSEGAEANTCDSNLLVSAPFNGSNKAWELQIESVLKDFYESIRKQRLPLHGASGPLYEQPSTNNLSVSSMLRRTPSVLSKAPSDNLSYRGRSHTDFRSMNKTWNSKTRSRPRLYPTSTVASSRTSLDDQSVWSPAGSSTWSRYSYGKTQTSMSMESLGSHFAQGDYQQAIGFANALSQAIIREEGMTIASEEEFSRVAPLLEDETLELVGAPWAKEGILKHKHHLEALDKKAKDRTWNECFAVIEKGYMRLFSFSMNSKSMRNKNKSRPSTGGVVGGGNWMDNAEALDSFLLRQTIASALPPPGYSKSRPHVWALSLPNGAVHLFQVGTPDIVREFVSTANYWSARLSKEPLMGGVSNIEYGWGENVINTALIRPGSKASTHGHVSRPSMASSLRSSVDHATGTAKARLPGDKVALSDWSPPTQSMMASNLMEVDQLRALTDYVKQVEEELSRHNELRAPMLIAFSPRHPNAAKSMANWERKSSYLLREIVKFRTYIDSLTASQNLKEKIYAERERNEERAQEATEDMSRRSAARETDGASEAPQASKPVPT